MTSSTGRLEAEEGKAPLGVTYHQATLPLYEAEIFAVLNEHELSQQPIGQSASRVDDMAMGTVASDKRRQRLAPSRLALPIARARALSLKPPQPHRRPNGTPYPAEARGACSPPGKGSGSRDDLTIRTTETRSIGTAPKPIDLLQKPGRKGVWISPPFRTST